MTPPPYLLVLATLLIGCTSSTKNDKETAADSTTIDSASVASPTPANDSMSVHLPDLKAKGLLTNTQTVRVANDPVFHQAKTYQAISLRSLLEKHTNLKHLDPAQTQIVFECEDGYSPSMPLSVVLGRDAWLAVRDNDAPKGEDWITAVKDGQTKVVAPFYVIYSNVGPKEYDYKWPYNLVKISLVQTAKEFAAIYPHDDDTMVKGFGLFQKNCGICHALNGIGGQMGPELNYPKSVTEYWRSPDDIKAFVKQPAAYRQGSKMPAVTYLSDNELDEVVRYLQYMVKHKKA